MEVNILGPCLVSVCRMRVSLTVLELRKKWNPGHSYVKYFRTSGGEMHAFNYLH